MNNNLNTHESTVEMFGLQFDQCALQQAVKMDVQRRGLDEET